MRRPIVAITSYGEPVDRGDWLDQPSIVLARTYVDKVEAAGGIAFVIPPRLDADVTLAEEILDHVDALILAGGADVDAALYGELPHPTAQATRPDRDALEIALAVAAARRGTPTLGICRGMQVMAVAAGGALEQHVPDRTGTDLHAENPGAFTTHPVRVVADTLLSTILDAVVDVPTYHHQSVASHPGYEASAWHADGTLEAMEDRSAPFRLAVQWHPEAGPDPRLFEALVAAARAGRSA